MAKKTLYLLGILLTIIIGTFLYWKLCCGSCNIGAVVTETETKVESDKKIVVEKVPEVVTSINPLAIKDANGSFEYHNNDNFNFNFSGFSIIEPVPEGVQIGADTLKNYLESNPSKTINITGYYTNSETNSSAFPNLGIARANSIKNYLASKGIPSKQINTNGVLKDNIVHKDSIYIGPLDFNFTAFNDTSSNNQAEELKALGEKIKANPLVLYFNSGQTQINLTQEQRQKINDLSKYLDKTDSASCLITGHTDNTGKRITNIKLGQARANFAKDYLIQNGIPANKIKTDSKGPDSPIANNATKEGRRKNRRTVVTIN